jgi:hypothetical protein
MSKVDDRVKEIVDNFNGNIKQVPVYIRHGSIRIDTITALTNINPAMPEEVKWNKSFNNRTYTYKLDEDGVKTSIISDLGEDIRRIAIKCSPAKAPARTNYIKSIKQITRNFNLREASEEQLSHMYDIRAYYNHATQTDLINSSTNDVHRKNIHNLLVLMEKKYGATKKNSN